jgi:MinD-like ATPase involved in chromosome partitioning or flagellar assembly/ActR/RegA family two-component response regulator
VDGSGAPGGPWVVVLDEDGAWRERLGGAWLATGGGPRLAGVTGQVVDAERLVRENGADVLLVDEGVGRQAGLAVAAALARRLPSAKVYLTTASPSREVWEEARRHGLRGLVPKPYDALSVGRRLREDEDLDRRVADSLFAAPPAAPQAVPPPAAAPEAPRTIAVCSFKGGVGKSLVSVSLGLAAASPGARRRRATVLVDAEEGLGSTAALLGVPPRPTLEDWAEYRGERHVDPAMAQRMIATTRFGLSCVFAPGAADRSVDGELMETVLATLSRMYGLVVVDCAPAVTAAVFAALRLATTVLLLVEPTLDCLDRARRGLGALAAAGRGTGKVRVLCNQNRPGPGDFTPAECREALGLQVIGNLPFDVGAKRACNRCRPLACTAPRGPFMRCLCRAVDALVPGLAEAGRVAWPGGQGGGVPR